VKDGAVRRGVKLAALGLFYANRVPLRALRRVRGRMRYDLGGECRRCARCCEAPSIAANVFVWHMPLLRRLFLAWQRHVNGFELQQAVRRGRTFVFRCTHFDAASRSCDSYASRPGMCRDYPRALLEQPEPEFLAGCGYRPVAKDGARMLRVLQEQPMTDEQRRRIVEGLRLE
jgi:uncharacterized protein